VRAAETVVVQQCAYLRVAGDQPGLIARRGPDPMYGSVRAHGAQLGSGAQRMRLRKG
jgi:hypothetical protein